MHTNLAGASPTHKQSTSAHKVSHATISDPRTPYLLLAHFLALNVHQEQSVPMCTALTSLTRLFPSLSTLPFLSSYLNYLYPQDPCLRLVHPSRSPPLCNLNYHFLCQPTPPSFHLANFGRTNGLWELKMSQEWVNVGLMSAVSRSNSRPNPPLSPFLHFCGHFFHLDNSFVSHRIAT